MGFLKNLLRKASKEISQEEAAKISAKFEDMTGKPIETRTAFGEDDRPVPSWEQGTGSSNNGLPYGPEAPFEENQFNFNGPYQEYFENIFAEDFPAFQVSKEEGFTGRRAAYTFTSGGVKRLVVEILYEGSGVYKLRDECRRQGVPYLRFYHDHAGWWNLRSYVKDRIRKAVG